MGSIGHNRGWTARVGVCPQVPPSQPMRMRWIYFPQIGIIITSTMREERNVQCSDQTKWECEIYGRKYLKGDLDAAFSKVQSEKGWKYPINALVKEDEVLITRAAIAWFAGGQAQFSRPRKDGMVRVRAPGYYKLIGS